MKGISHNDFHKIKNFYFNRKQTYSKLFKGSRQKKTADFEDMS